VLSGFPCLFFLVRFRFVFHLDSRGDDEKGEERRLPTECIPRVCVCVGASNAIVAERAHKNQKYI